MLRTSSITSLMACCLSAALAAQRGCPADLSLFTLQAVSPGNLIDGWNLTDDHYYPYVRQEPASQFYMNGTNFVSVSNDLPTRAFADYESPHDPAQLEYYTQVNSKRLACRLLPQNSGSCTLNCSVSETASQTGKTSNYHSWLACPASQFNQDRFLYITGKNPKPTNQTACSGLDLVVLGASKGNA